MISRPSLLGRAIAAVLLMVGFYALALAIIAALVAIPLAEIRYAHRVEFRLAVFCAVGAIAILRGIVPRLDRFEPPGPKLTREEHPRLFAVLEDIARSTGQRMPSEVYLIADVNAWVAQRGGIMGIGSRRVMGLGLPLLQRLTVDQMRAVIAHEFGHYVGGDTALGPWIYRTRAAIGRTLAALARHSSVLMKPFEWYGLGFLRITHAISRRQEYAADALAARIVGAAQLGTGLTTIHAVGAAFVPYWMSEVAPVLEHGYRPPIGAGFGQFLAQPAIASQVSAAVDKELTGTQVDPYDTHPPLRERLAALGVDARRDAAEAEPRAITLLDDEEAVEDQLLAMVLAKKTGKPLARISWEEVGSRVWSTIWRDKVRVAGHRLDGITPARIPALVADLPGTAVRFGFLGPRQAAETRDGSINALELLACGLSVLLLDRGWTVSALPGEMATFSREGKTLTPVADLHRLAAGEMSSAGWETVWRDVGLLDADLGARSAATLPAPPQRASQPTD